MAQQLTELQEKWLQALESGEYEQSEGVLFDGVGHCCLGVACRVIGICPVLRPSDDDVPDDDERAERHYYFDEEYETAPKSAISALRLRDEHGTPTAPIVLGEEEHERLTAANDAGVTFAEIAAAIRANPENFFLPPEAQS